MKLWTCPKCKRKFKRTNQIHSCKEFPLDQHFKRKEDIARPLFDLLKMKIRRDVGSFKIVSLPCCIHLATSSTFAAVYALRDRIRIHFTLDDQLENVRIEKYTKMSKKRYLYSIDVKSAREIDKELLGWLKHSYNLR